MSVRWYSIKDKVFTTAEALVRIRDIDGKLIPQGLFIDVAEKRGLIIEFGEIVFRKVCEFITKENPTQYGVQYIEVNLSMAQCGYENLKNLINKSFRRGSLNLFFLLQNCNYSPLVVSGGLHVCECI